MKPFDENGLFYSPKREKQGIRRVAVRGASVMILAQAGSVLVQMASTMVLARLLVPADFGVVTMVTTFSLLLCSFGLNGFTEAILQRDDINDMMASNLFWINVGSGIVLTFLFAAAGSLMARFYHDPLVKPVAEGMSITIIVASFSVIHLALLNRGMHFTAVSGNGMFSRLVSVIVSIVLAVMHCGYWALVAGYIAQQISLTIGAWIMCRWTPSRPHAMEGTGDAIKFAVNVYSHFGFNYFARNTDNLLVGWRFRAHALGFYKKAYDLFNLPLNQLLSPIGAVVVSTLSHFKRERLNYQRYFLSGLSVLAFIGMGVGTDFTLVGKDLIRFLLGPGWGETGNIFVFFGPGIGIMLLYNTHGWLHLSIGHPDRWFRWGIVEFICTAGLFLIALPWGSRGIAIAWTVSFFVLMVPAFWYAGKPIGLGVNAVLKTIWRFFVACLAGGCLVAWLIHFAVPFGAAPGAMGALARVLSVSLIFFVIYVGAVILLHGGTGPIRQTADLLSELMPSRRGKIELPEAQALASANVGAE